MHRKATSADIIIVRNTFFLHIEHKVSVVHIAQFGTKIKFFALKSLSMAKSTGLGRWKNAQNPYFWVGGAFEVSALDPVRLYADIIYGAGAMATSCIGAMRFQTTRPR